MRRRVRAIWTQLTLRAGSYVLAGYAVAGGIVGLEVFAFLALWPLGVALLVAMLAGGAWTRRRLRHRSTSIGTERAPDPADPSASAATTGTE